MPAAVAASIALHAALIGAFFDVRLLDTFGHDRPIVRLTLAPSIDADAIAGDDSDESVDEAADDSRNDRRDELGDHPADNPGDNLGDNRGERSLTPPEDSRDEPPVQRDFDAGELVNADVSEPRAGGAERAAEPSSDDTPDRQTRPSLAEIEPMPAEAVSIPPEERAVEDRPSGNPPVTTESDPVRSEPLQSGPILSGNDERQERPIATAAEAERLERIVVESHARLPVPSVAGESPVRPSVDTESPAVQTPAQTTVTIDESSTDEIRDEIERLARELAEDGELFAEHAFDVDGRDYAVTLAAAPARAVTDLDRITVTITTHENGQTLTARTQMKRLAFSSYAQFVDRWDPRVQIHDDVVDGRFHSNSEIYLGYSSDVKPTFLGRVTTSHRRVNTSNARGRFNRDEMFVGGLETGVRRIMMPRQFAPQLDAAEEAPLTYPFDTDTRIVFAENGSFTATSLQDDSVASRPVKVNLGDKLSYLVGDDKVQLHVSGTVNGRVLVYTPDRVVIEDDLIYADDPLADAGADDYLGIVAGRTIEIAPPAVTGGGDLTVHGALFAKSRFAISSYRARDEATLTIVGSLAAGSITATEPRFATVISFDPRLENARPPGFPMTDRYELEPWDGTWLVESQGEVEGTGPAN